MPVSYEEVAVMTNDDSSLYLKHRMDIGIDVDMLRSIKNSLRNIPT